MRQAANNEIVDAHLRMGFEMFHNWDGKVKTARKSAMVQTMVV
jgi:hypothetical protein